MSTSSKDWHCPLEYYNVHSQESSNFALVEEMGAMEMPWIHREESCTLEFLSSITTTYSSDSRTSSAMVAYRPELLAPAIG